MKGAADVYCALNILVRCLVVGIFPGLVVIKDVRDDTLFPSQRASIYPASTNTRPDKMGMSLSAFQHTFKMSSKLDSGLPIHCAAALAEAKLALPQGHHCSPHHAVQTPKPSSWHLLVPPDLYSDQKDTDLYFAEEKLVLSKPQRSRAPLRPRRFF